MAKTVNDIVLDQALNYIKNNGTRLCVCSSQPTTYTEAITTYNLATKNITSADYTGPAAGSQRQLTVNQQTGVSITGTGTANFIAIADSVNSALLFVTTCTAQALTSGGSVTLPAWVISEQSPT